MNNSSERYDFQNELINELHLYIAQHVSNGYVLFCELLVKTLLLILIFFILEFIQKKILSPIFKKIVTRTSFTWDDILLKENVFNSFFQLIPLVICYSISPFIFYHHPQSFYYTGLIFSILLVLVIVKFIFTLINALISLKNQDNSYRNVAFQSFGELAKIIIGTFAGFVIITLLFNVSWAKIFTFLGATTAVLLLVFKDSILGFVSGISVAMSKQVKVGDWISIPKYKLDGYVREISLVTTKIQKFDKTISSIPTYDLISTEVQNYEPMRNSKARRIKRSIIFSSVSFKFVDDELFDYFINIGILKDYLLKKKKELENYEQTNQGKDSANIRRLTNIGIFRKYVQLYLANNKHISQTDTLMVRQLEPDQYGLPLEIYCFTNTSDWLEYEEIQSNIFDHLLTIANDFKLKVVQVTPS